LKKKKNNPGLLRVWLVNNAMRELVLTCGAEKIRLADESGKSKVALEKMREGTPKILDQFWRDIREFPGEEYAAYMTAVLSIADIGIKHIF
jgi:hypothetical protein